MKIKEMLRASSDKRQAEVLQKFFKTGKGDYGEGDLFLGIKVPVIRKITTENFDLRRKDIQSLLKSKYHEERLAALFVLVKKYSNAGQRDKHEIFTFYLNNRKGINNWDLVDLSAPWITGAYLYDKDKSILFELANSSNIWDRRIAVISSFYFIKHGMFDVTLKLAGILIKDDKDLIQKAVGWMLREIGKRDINSEENFLHEHYKKMPRTMLRYSIEKFPEEKRQLYLKGKI